MNSLVALHELYKYINKYYDQVSVMSLCCRHGAYRLPVCSLSFRVAAPAIVSTILQAGSHSLQCISQQSAFGIHSYFCQRQANEEMPAERRDMGGGFNHTDISDIGCG